MWQTEKIDFRREKKGAKKGGVPEKGEAELVK